MNFVDLHAHVLPGMDDGPRTFAESLEMLALCRAAGTDQIVATPHMFAPGLGSEDRAVVRTAFERFLRALKQLAPAGQEGPLGDLRVHLGAENYVSAEFLQALDSEGVQTLGGSRCLLVEFWPLTTATAARQAVDRVQAAGFVPLVAHVERYGFLRERPASLEHLVEAGWVAQVNAAAVLGLQGLRAAQLVDRWLRSGLISVVASDSHDARGRTPELHRVYAHLEARYGAVTADLCLRANPLALLSDEPPTRPPETPRFSWWRRFRST